VPTTFALGQLLALAQFSLFAAVRAAPGLYESFGFVDARPAVISLALFGYLSAPLDEVLHVLTNAVSRRFEYQADAFAVGLGMGRQLRAGLLHLEGTNKVGRAGHGARGGQGAACAALAARGMPRRLGPRRALAPPPSAPSIPSSLICPPSCSALCPPQSALNVDPLYSAYHYSHPPLCQRLAAIDAALRGQHKKGS
jgi:Zn-dependent protease with chaperone function